jgi:hypothetical protein
MQRISFDDQVWRNGVLGTVIQTSETMLKVKWSEPNSEGDLEEWVWPDQVLTHDEYNRHLGAEMQATREAFIATQSNPKKPLHPG